MRAGKVVGGDAVRTLRRRMEQVLYCWNERGPLLRENFDDLLHKKQKIGHHRLVVTLNHALVARRHGRADYRARE